MLHYFLNTVKTVGRYRTSLTEVVDSQKTQLCCVRVVQKSTFGRTGLWSFYKPISPLLLHGKRFHWLLSLRIKILKYFE